MTSYTIDWSTGISLILNWFIYGPDRPATSTWAPHVTATPLVRSKVATVVTVSMSLWYCLTLRVVYNVYVVLRVVILYDSCATCFERRTFMYDFI